MKYTVFAALLVVASAVTPVQNVIQLLDGMPATGKAEKHDGQVQFTTYKQFLVQDPAEGLEVSASDAYGYEFQSHGVIEMFAQPPMRIFVPFNRTYPNQMDAMILVAYLTHSLNIACY